MILEFLKEFGLETGAIITILTLLTLYFGKITTSGKMIISKERFDDVWGGLFFLFLFVLIPLALLNFISQIYIIRVNIYISYFILLLPLISFFIFRKKGDVGWFKNKYWLILPMIILNVFNFWRISQDISLPEYYWIILSLIILFLNLTCEAMIIAYITRKDKEIEIILNNKEKIHGNLISSNEKYLGVERKNKKEIINREYIISIKEITIK